MFSDCAEGDLSDTFSPYLYGDCCVAWAVGSPMTFQTCASGWAYNINFYLCCPNEESGCDFQLIIDIAPEDEFGELQPVQEIIKNPTYVNCQTGEFWFSGFTLPDCCTISEIRINVCGSEVPGTPDAGDACP